MTELKHYFLPSDYELEPLSVEDISQFLINTTSALPELLNSLANIAHDNVNEKSKLIIKKLMELTKSQGGYISFCDIDNQNDLRGLIVSTLELDDAYGNIDDVHVKHTSNTIGAYFPMKPEMLHYQAVTNQKVLICNDSKFLKNHQCVGLNIYNLMYIPIILTLENEPDNTVVGLICLCNTEYGNYCPRFIEILKPLISIAQLVFSYKIELLEKLAEERKFLIENRAVVGDMTSFIVRNSSEISAIFDAEGLLLIHSSSFLTELKYLVDGGLDEITSLKDMEKHPNLSKIKEELDLVISNWEKKSVVHKLIDFDTVSGKIYLLCNFSAILSKGKSSPIGTYFYAQNVTTNKHLEDKLKNSNSSLQTALVEKDAYMSRISHELRTPLNSIYGFAQLVEMSNKSGTNINPEWVSTILKSSKLLLRLVDEVLDLSKINSGNIKLSIEDVPLTKAIKDSVHMFRHDIEEKNITVKLNIHKNGVIVRGDYHRILQVLNNILSNAIKYNKQNGKIDITYLINYENDIITVSIKDTGIGIEEQYLKFIGQPFNRLGMQDSQISGSGLGLSLSFALLEQMKCGYKVTSVKDYGTIVELIFPLSKTLNIVEVEPEYLAIGALDINKIKNNDNAVLYIEDNLSNYKLMETIVKERLKYDLIVCTQGRRGLEIAQSLLPKIIILDMGLPDITGNEVLIELKTSQLTNKIPVIVYSADANPSSQQTALSLGAATYLTKPTDIEVLEVEIKKYMKKK